MGKVNYDNLSFDSEWEKEFYLHLINDLGISKNNIWRNILPITGLIARKRYTPDFIFLKDKTFHIVEVKGNYNPYANHFQDEMIHKEMKAKDQDELRQYVSINGIDTYFDDKFIYEKVKFLKAYGWVDYDWKNPNTRVSQQKEKINDLSAELKELKEFKKNALRYWSYKFKQANKEKLTKKQCEWLENYGCDMILELKKEKEK